MGAKRIFKYAIPCIMLLLVFYTTEKINAKAVTFVQKEKALDNSVKLRSLRRNTNGRLEYYTITEKEDKNGKSGQGIITHIINGNMKETRKNRGVYYKRAEDINFIRDSHDGKKTAITGQTGRAFRIDILNSNYKVERYFTDSIINLSDYGKVAVAHDLYDTKKYIYYVYSISDDFSNIYVRRINKKTNKAVTYTINEPFILKRNVSEMLYDVQMKFENNRLYVLGKDRIYTYSLKGKKIREYDLPKGGIHFEDSDGDINDLTFFKMSICNDYIYYANVNGVYRCNWKKDKGFKLYYDAVKDEKFKKGWEIQEICAINE